MNVLTDEKLARMLTVPCDKKLHMVLDTDTFNEVDDQFALAYALLSTERLVVEAVYAAPFLNDRAETPAIGMEKSYDEIMRLLGKMGAYGNVPVFKGSTRFMLGGGPVDSPAARDLISRAMRFTSEDPLYVVGIGACTDIASALIMEPAIKERIVIVWLGGNPTYWPTAQEFNLSQDIPSSQVLFDCGAPLVHVPALTVASHLLTTRAELLACIGGANELCDALTELFTAYSQNHFAWAKEIWDISAIAYLICPDWMPARFTRSPKLNLDNTYAPEDNTRHIIKSCIYAMRNPIFNDLFTKLKKL